MRLACITLVLLLAQMRSAQSQIGPCDQVNYLYRYPGDCYKFLACTTYGAVPMDCPANLVFYEREQRCDYKYLVPECREIPPCSTSTCIQGYCSSATRCTCYSGYTGAKCDTAQTTAPCPVYPCPVDVPSYSYPSWEDLNCQSYYNCNRGSLVKRTCPFGQKFDVVTLTCQNQNEPDRFFCDIFIGSPA